MNGIVHIRVSKHELIASYAINIKRERFFVYRVITYFLSKCSFVIFFRHDLIFWSIVWTSSIYRSINPFWYWIRNNLACSVIWHFHFTITSKYSLLILFYFRYSLKSKYCLFTYRWLFTRIIKTSSLFIFSLLNRP